MVIGRWPSWVGIADESEFEERSKPELITTIPLSSVGIEEESEFEERSKPEAIATIPLSSVGIEEESMFEEIGSSKGEGRRFWSKEIATAI